MLISTTNALEESLSQPHESTIEVLRQSGGDILLLGAGGKMGTSLATMARRAFDAVGLANRVLAVSRFSDSSATRSLSRSGVETLQGDLFDSCFVNSLPEFDYVIYMVGQKFGTSTAPEATWATNAFIPGIICQKFANSNIASFSTGNVYPLVGIDSRGSKESDALLPMGEYAMSAVARERVLQYFCQSLDIPAVILRLNYSTELRYGVLVDLARRVFCEEPIPLSTGYFNCIWQGDANNMTLRSLTHVSSPPRVLNLTGPETISCRDVCLRFGELMGREVTFLGSEEPTALLSDSAVACQLLGDPLVNINEMIERTAHWVANSGEFLDAPTHFEVRDGKF